MIAPQIGQTQLILQNTDAYRQGVGRLAQGMYTPVKNQGACSNSYNNTAVIDGQNVNLSKDDMKIQPNAITYDSADVNSSHEIFLPIIYNKFIYSASRNGKEVKIVRGQNGQLGVKSSSLGPIKISYRYNWASIIGILSSIICWGLGIYLIFNQKRKLSDA